LGVKTNYDILQRPIVQLSLKLIWRKPTLLNTIYKFFIRDITPMPHNGCRPPKKGV